MSFHHRYAVLIGGVSGVAALALAIASTSTAAAHRPGGAATAQAAGQAPTAIVARPPLGRPKPSGLAPDLRPAVPAVSAVPAGRRSGASPDGFGRPSGGRATIAVGACPAA